MATLKKITRALAMSLRAKAEKGKTPTELVAWLLKAHAVKATVADVRKALSGKNDVAKGAGKPKGSSSPAPSATSQARAHAREKPLVDGPPPPLRPDLPPLPFVAVVTSDTPVPETKEGRVLHIARMMSLGTWPVWPASRAFREKLAAHWGIEEATVRAYAAEAHRVVTLDPDDRDQLRMSLSRTFMGVAEEARSMVNDVTGLPDWGAVIKGYETAAKYSGIEFESKVRVSGSIALDEIDELRSKILGGGDGSSGAD